MNCLLLWLAVFLRRSSVRRNKWWRGRRNTGGWQSSSEGCGVPAPGGIWGRWGECCFLYWVPPLEALTVLEVLPWVISGNFRGEFALKGLRMLTNGIIPFHTDNLGSRLFSTNSVAVQAVALLSGRFWCDIHFPSNLILSAVAMLLRLWGSVVQREQESARLFYRYIVTKNFASHRSGIHPSGFLTGFQLLKHLRKVLLLTFISLTSSFNKLLLNKLACLHEV